MTKRLKIFWNTIRVLWKMFPRAAQVLIILFSLAILIVLILSPERNLWLILCGLLALAGLGAGLVIYRLLFQDKK